MKSFKIFIFCLAGIFILNFFFLSAAQAQNLEPPDLKIQIGGAALNFKPVSSCGDNSYCIGWIGQYIAVIYRYGVGLAAVLAAIMIMVGGFLWLASAGNPSQITKGKEFIISAITGLVLALFSFIILQTINPRLVALEPVAVAVPSDQGYDATIRETVGDGGETVDGGEGEGEGESEGGGIDETAVRTELESMGVGINNPPCTSGQTQGCTNVADMPQETIDSLGELAGELPEGSVVVTGGTEPGHQSHGEGLPPVDLRMTDDMVDYVESSYYDIDESITYGTGYRVGNDLFVEESDPPHYHHVPNYYQ